MVKKRIHLDEDGRVIEIDALVREREGKIKIVILGNGSPCTCVGEVEVYKRVSL